MSTTAHNLRTLSRLASECIALAPQIEAAANLIADSLQAGGKVLACGNGGSAADAQHFVAELVGRFKHERKPLPAISLSSDPSVVTCIGNDYGYADVFARQVRGLGKRGDVLLAITTSGRSHNVLGALVSAGTLGMRGVVLMGAPRGGGDSAELFPHKTCIQVPSTDTARIQELHTAILHSMCEIIEQRFVTKETP